MESDMTKEVDKPKMEYKITPADRVLRFLGFDTTAVLVEKGHMAPPKLGEEASHIHKKSVDDDLNAADVLLAKMDILMPTLDASKEEVKAVQTALANFAAAHKRLAEDNATKETPKAKS